MFIEDIATISPSGRRTVAYIAPSGVAYVEVSDDHEEPDKAAHRAMMLFLANEDQKSGETILQARARIRDYLRESPIIDVTEAQFALSDPRPVRVYREAN